MFDVRGKLVLVAVLVVVPQIGDPITPLIPCAGFYKTEEISDN